MGRGFSFHSGTASATTLGKLFTPLCLFHQAVLGGTSVKIRKVSAGYRRGVVYHP